MVSVKVRFSFFQTQLITSHFFLLAQDTATTSKAWMLSMNLQVSFNITCVVCWDYLSWVWRTPFKKSKPADHTQVKLWFEMRTEGLDPLIKTSIVYSVFLHGISTSKVSINVTEMWVCIGPPGIIQSNPYNEVPSCNRRPISLISFNKTLQWRTQECCELFQTH